MSSAALSFSGPRGFVAADIPSEIPTPALMVDGAVVRRNVDKMAAYVAAHGIGLRPHTKTHKSRMLGRLQMEAGAIGLTVAKAGEAELMGEVADDIMMVFPVVDPARCRLLAELARTKTLRVAIDSSLAVQRLSDAAVAAKSTIGLLVEIDMGVGRTGVATAQDSLALAQQISRSPNVRLDGLLCYPGHIWDKPEQQAAPLAAAEKKLKESLDLWAKHGLKAPIVAGGTTPTAYQSDLVKAFTELHPGTYVFNDMNTANGGFCALAECAARIIFTVSSDAVKDQIVLDGGSKTLTSDMCVSARESGHGYIVEYPEAKITRLSEEHACVDVSRCKTRPKVGERVTVIPNHICPCINLQDSFWWFEAGKQPVRMPVDARGRLL